MVTFPNFLVIGASKCGTSTLYAHLAGNPQIFMSRVKEPHFFAFGRQPFQPGPKGSGRSTTASTRCRSILGCLSARLGPAQPASVRVRTCMSRDGGTHRDFNADMKLIVSLRQPVDRAYSSYNFAKQLGIESCRSLAEAFEAEPERIARGYSLLLRYRDVGLYAQQLAGFQRLFPGRQIKVVIYEDLVRTRAERSAGCTNSSASSRTWQSTPASGPTPPSFPTRRTRCTAGSTTRTGCAPPADTYCPGGCAMG